MIALPEEFRGGPRVAVGEVRQLGQWLLLADDPDIEMRAVEIVRQAIVRCGAERGVNTGLVLQLHAAELLEGGAI